MFDTFFAKQQRQQQKQRCEKLLDLFFVFNGNHFIKARNEPKMIWMKQTHRAPRRIESNLYNRMLT